MKMTLWWLTSLLLLAILLLPVVLPVEKNQNHSKDDSGFERVVLFARVTEYSKTEKGCDPDTKQGRTSTGVSVRAACEKTGKIGIVAVDPKIIPYGSLVVLPDGRKYLAADTGGAVKSRKAAIVLAKRQKKPEKFGKAPVLDFYSYSKIVPENWIYVSVLKDTKNTFIPSKLSERKKRLSSDYWKKVTPENI
jgi:3D (Asp-Asp-Asp) domain-containing protein